MKLEIKQMLLEGYTFGEIVENVILNNPNANRYMANNNTWTDSAGNLVGSVANFGLPGAVAGVYGNMGERQYQTQDSSKAQGNIGPWDKSMIARGQYFNNIDNNLSNTYDNNKLQYFLNPLVGGPIKHALTKGARSTNNGLYKLLKNKNSPDINNGVTVASNVNNGAFNADYDVGRNSANNYADDVADIRRNHTGHYLLNPFVAGPVNELIGHVGGAVNQGVRVVTSPTSKSGDTLVQNSGRR